jgi:hypothetical protein
MGRYLCDDGYDADELILFERGVGSLYRWVSAILSILDLVNYMSHRRPYVDETFHFTFRTMTILDQRIAGMHPDSVKIYDEKTIPIESVFTVSSLDPISATPQHQLIIRSGTFKRQRQHSRTPVPTLPYTPDTKDDVILMNRRRSEIIPVHLPDVNNTAPMRLNRLAVHNLIPLDLQPTRRLPPKLAKVVRNGIIHADVPRLSRRIRQAPHGGRNDLCCARVVRVVEVVRKVAVRDSARVADVLVLLRVVLVCLDEAHAVEARLEERPVVAAAAVAVQSVDQADGHLGEGVRGDFVD